ncbi:RNA recognition motif domain-containing protein [Synechococcus elongatus]|uniref:RNA-binding region RNP-1 n=1 Tax=Synechococcus elongatus (strain ATCC 33912 / PCC 7942 / FACHB-805) TaxID=1140 RepID=Q31Q47_SYNE7|nr:RNA-binding region RNP-1 [Synechococcus elongatus]ABB56822.1 RNA-binding region RNP-1 [Synechococcus elongatus PCC 7942 = FACHB-805]AJD58649.1 RNA-binding protein [Synechococcus elongatus UTEX 2973]MBD2588692.1 RNA-binding protein [Synechococcus elongatus FACHB-242]MBD2689720.1 RNA-binding protein [Synechococcus elongatus FACHB-1061]MBD2708326.1 RNA-binding protein [Synechococcus elongatus PCC 7942 = FACHB-805]
MSVRVYIGNLPRDIEQAELDAVFAEAGEVSAKLVTDRKTGKSRGFAFATVASDELADALIERFNGTEVQGSTLKLEKAQPRERDNEGGNNRRRSGGGGNDNRRSGKSAPRVISSGPEGFQPDPRWAQELEKLKELLAAQTVS